MAEEQQAPLKKNRTLLIVSITAVVCIAAAVFAYFAFIAKPSAEVAPKDFKSVKIPSMTVNLADTDSHRYLKTTISLEYSDDKVKTELDTSIYKVKDGILKVLRNTKASTLTDPQQTDALKKTLLDEINSRLQNGKITGLYFEELLVQ